MEVPIVVICFNNYKYVENTIKQIVKINPLYYKNIIILDNCSNCVDTIYFLNHVDVNVIFNKINNGPWVNPYVNSDLYNKLPDKFILTDPDLEFNELLPSNFIEILCKLSDENSCNKIGFALDISDFNNMYQNVYVNNLNIYQHEIQFWSDKVPNNTYELYNAAIDTTMCLVNKKHIERQPIRIAGNFTAKHLPWYKNNKIYSVYENYVLNCKTTTISTISRLIIPYIDTNFLKISKHGEVFLIEKNNINPNLNFWDSYFTNWEDETFVVFDKYLHENKIFIDIGGWIGTTAMYGSRKSKHVYVVEADKESVKDMNLNMETNCCNNYTLINKAIFNVDEKDIKFGKNKFLGNSRMNDSTSQIYDDFESSNEFYTITTITLQTMIRDYRIDATNISLIKVDIEGGEENILNELYEIHDTFKVPLYVSFHFDWWKDKTLDRFLFLTAEQKVSIITYPFISIFFSIQ